MNIAQAAQTNGTAAAKTSTNVVSGQYAIGSATLYAAYIDGELLAASLTPTKVDGYRVAGKYSMGAVDLMASYQEVKQKVAGTKDKISGLRADYNLSKTAAAYIGYEQWDSYALNDTRKLTSVGLRKSF